MRNEAQRNMDKNKMIGRLQYLEKENMRLMEHIVFLKKNGYTYDQVTSRMLLCDICGANLTGEVKESANERNRNIIKSTRVDSDKRKA